MPSPLYSVTSRLVHSASWLPGTLGTSVAGRRRAAERWESWAIDQRRDEPLLWVHAASVGEAIMMEPVVARLHRMVPDLQVVVSHSSPSLSAWKLAWSAHTDFVPADLAAHADRFLEAVRPAALAIARRDLWPILVDRAVTQVPVAIVGALTTPRHLFPKLSLHRLYAPVLERVSWVGAVAERDARTWCSFGARADRVEVTGDPAHDRVLERIPDLALLRQLRSWASGRSIVVAGSVEPDDLSVVVEAAGRVLPPADQARMIVVPHDPSRRVTQRWVAKIAGEGLAAKLWTDGPIGSDTQVVVVGRTGLLADLWALGALAYVGGGFRRRKLHSVAEPAAYGLPILCGPHTQPQGDAEALAHAGALTALASRSAAAQLAHLWSSYLAHPELRDRHGLAGRRVLRRGAADRSATRLAELLLG